MLAVLVHPVHETVSEIEWNGDKSHLELAVRLHALDEQWIRRQYDRDASIETIAIDYVRKNVRLNVAGSTSSAMRAADLPLDTYRWVGRQEEGAHVWWFLEIAPHDRQPPRTLRHSMLFERETSYVNRVVVLGRSPKRAATLTIARPVMRLDPEANLEAADDGEPDGGSDLDR